jgi:hypothetical protein
MNLFTMIKRSSINLLVFAISVSFGPSCLFADTSTNDRAVSTTNGADDLLAAIARSENYLVRFCRPNGRFVYIANGGPETHEYNIIRHAGAIYALALYNAEHPDAKVVAAMMRAADYLERYYIFPPKGSADMLAVWASRRGVNGTRRAELGASGLGLLALASVAEVSPKSISVAELEQIARFIVNLQNADGSFCCRFDYATGRDSSWRSLYFPGEAAMGLIALYKLDHDPAWLNAAAKGLTYLAESRRQQLRLPDDSWALIATNQILPFLRTCNPPVIEQRLLAHAIRIGTDMAAEEEFGQARGGAVKGSFDSGGRTTPVATRVEALLALQNCIPNSQFRNQIRGAARAGISFLITAQIKGGTYDGGIPALNVGSVGGLAIDGEKESRIRIDYVQHALCAMLRYEALIESIVKPAQS